MDSNTPEDPFVLEITSATYGGKDYTSDIQSIFDTYLAQNPAKKAWTFTSGTSFFNEDPNPGITKATTIVYRNTILSSDGSVSWSTFKSRALTDSGNQTTAIVFDGTNDTTWIPPSPPSTGQCIIAAFWYNEDVTATAQNTATNQGLNPFKGTTFSISVGALGPDPATVPDVGKTTKSKQFSVTYGNWGYPGRWTFHVAVGLSSADSWSLEIPVLFPPVQLPSLMSVVSYVSFQNLAGGQDLYPQIYGADMDLYWDGRANNFLVPSGVTKDVDLIARAGCKEREKYYCGWTSADGSLVWGCGDTNVVASSSSMASGCGLSYTPSRFGSTPRIFLDTIHYNKPMTYSPADLRLNIYSATWGSSDYTEFVRQQYISDTISNPPTDTSNSWSFTPRITAFGDDPNPGTQKACVIIYRIAYRVGTTDGVINGLNDPDPWDPQYASQHIQPLHTDKYPVLSDLTAFGFAGSRQDPVININLLAQDLTPWEPDPAQLPHIFIPIACWANRNFAPYVQNAVTSGPPSPADSQVSVSIAAMGGGKDPWPGVAKQLTVLVGYSTGTGKDWLWRTLVALNNADPWIFTIPGIVPAPMKQSPSQFSSTVPSTYNTVTFKNNTGFICWPQVVTNAGQIFWDGSLQPTDASGNTRWKLSSGGGSCDLRLVEDAQCVDGNLYSVSFACEQKTYPPFSGWIKASTQNPQFAVTMTYEPDINSSATGKYAFLREVRYVGS